MKDPKVTSDGFAKVISIEVPHEELSSMIDDLLSCKQAETSNGNYFAYVNPAWREAIEKMK